jgi:hypothetical protein
VGRVFKKDEDFGYYIMQEWLLRALNKPNGNQS